MWNADTREQAWRIVPGPWDLVIIGGGITGAGVLRLAANAGLRCLLLEAGDFSSGTSSRSSKLVHGGFRYMRSRQFDVTRESVRERQWMLRAAPGLVQPLCFLMPNFSSYHTPDWQFHLGVILYDLFGRKWKHRACDPNQVRRLLPAINPGGLLRAYQYEDAVVDDSRLVLRLLLEAVQAGAVALNYARVERLLRTASGDVSGVVAADEANPGRRALEVQARAVIHATGPDTDLLRGQLGLPARIRQTRGSHLVFPRSRLPLNMAVTLMHPDDHRAMFALPWESVCLVGTTDLDHHPGNGEPCISPAETMYILQALQAALPALELTQDDVIASFAGLRPIVSSGAADPSAESRASVVWDEAGLVTITGGKLTTFRVMARHALEAARPRLSGRPVLDRRQPIFSSTPPLGHTAPVDLAALPYLQGRYGACARGLLAAAGPDELCRIETLPNLWAELRWAARSEGVVHLDDLLLRRVRLGLQLPGGGMHLLDRVRAIVQPELNWSDNRWHAEEARYHTIWQQYYSPTPGEQISLPPAPARLPIEA